MHGMARREDALFCSWLQDHTAVLVQLQAGWERGGVHSVLQPQSLPSTLCVRHRGPVQRDPVTPQAGHGRGAAGVLSNLPACLLVSTICIAHPNVVHAFVKSDLLGNHISWYLATALLGVDTQEQKAGSPKDTCDPCS